MSDRHIVRLTVTGRVQGVGFRAWLQHQAELQDLDGWVRNRLNGAVEAVAAGPDERVRALVEACRNGPRFARVETVTVDAADEAALNERGGAGGFAVLPTA